MGSYQSRVIELRDAESRLTPEELLRFKHAFRRLAMGYRTGADRTIHENAFKTYMLSDFPLMVRKAFFRFFNLMKFVCMLVCVCVNILLLVSKYF